MLRKTFSKKFEEMQLNTANGEITFKKPKIKISTDSDNLSILFHVIIIVNYIIILYQ